MYKKLMMACMAIAAFAAFVIAPAASASPVLTETKEPNVPSGIAVPTGVSITGKNTGETVFTGAFNVRCTVAHMTGTLTTNSGSSIKGTIPVGGAQFTGTGAGEDCTSALGNVKVTVNSELCLETVAGTDTVKTTGCGAAPVVFTLEVTGTGPCKYSTEKVTGTYTTNADAAVTVSEQESKKSEGGIFCPSSGKLDMVFDLYTTGATPGGAPGLPLYIS
jgi:hypothetical protein